MPLLTLTAIQKFFLAVRALAGVSFTLEPGEVHALLGENGAGKSTLIKVITGAHQPDGGSLCVGGQTWAGLTPALARELGIACIYQQPALFPDLTVAENIALRLERPRAWSRIDWPARHARAAALLRPLGADIATDAEVRQLSMPEQQLVEIACALGAGARILIMDEPTAALTQQEQQRLYAVVRDLRARGVGVIYISHRLEEIFALADRVTVLRDGQSLGTWPVAEVTEASLIELMVGRAVPDQPPPPTPPQLGEVVLDLRGLGCRAAGVQGINLALRAGEIVGLAGLVGAGRTELARILFGLTPADAGELRWRGTAVRIRSPQEAVRLGLAYLPEDRRQHGVILPMRIDHNVSLAVHRKLFPWKWLRFRRESTLATEAIHTLHIKAAGPAALVNTLSGGNQQKVALARWLATQPQMLILDEPTQGVDVGAKQEIHGIIRRLAAEGLAVLLISSDLTEVLGLSDRIGIMRGGRLVAVEPRSAWNACRVMEMALGKTGACA